MIDVRELRKTYGETEAVRGLSFSVAPGEVLGLVGPNGAGKTTTLRCLCGILPATSGTVAVAGADIVRDPVTAKSALAYIPDEPRLFESLSVVDHLRFHARLYRVDDPEKRIPRLLADLDLEGKEDELPGALSRGMKQKLALACAYIHDPRAILFDEPLTGLDPVAIRKAKDSIRDRARAGAAIVVSSHLLDLVQELAHRVLVLIHGRVAALGTVEELKAQHPDLAEGADLEDIFLRMASGDAARPVAPEDRAP